MKRLSYEEVKKLFSEKKYKLISKTYENNHSHVEAVCPNGHQFKITVANFKRNKGCAICSHRKHLSQTEAVSYFKEKKYTLISEYTNNHTPVKTKCPEGHLYEVRLKDFKKGYRCPQCNRNTPQGERILYHLLKSNQIPFEYQKSVDDNEYIRHIFDFVVADKFIIEYDGIQHFKPIKYFGGEEAFELQHVKDQMKDEYARKHHYQMIRIPYTLSTPHEIARYLSQYLTIVFNPKIDYSATFAKKDEILTYYLSHSVAETIEKYDITKSCILKNFKKVFGTSKRNYLKKDN